MKSLFRPAELALRAFGRFALLSAIVLVTVTAEVRAARRSRLDKLVDSAVSRGLDAAQFALVKPPQDLEVCFSPDEPCDAKLVKFLDSAAKSLDVAIFDLTLDQVAHHLLVASKRIPVRIVVDRKQAKAPHSLVPMLIKAGASVRLGRQRGIMHNKFMIVDGRMIETGSFNYTNGAAFKNNENQVYLANPAMVERYRKRFEKLWSEADAP